MHQDTAFLFRNLPPSPQVEAKTRSPRVIDILVAIFHGPNLKEPPGWGERKLVVDGGYQIEHIVVFFGFIESGVVNISEIGKMGFIGRARDWFGDVLNAQGRSGQRHWRTRKDFWVQGARIETESLETLTVKHDPGVGPEALANHPAQRNPSERVLRVVVD